MKYDRGLRGGFTSQSVPEGSSCVYLNCLTFPCLLPGPWSSCLVRLERRWHRQQDLVDLVILHWADVSRSPSVLAQGRFYSLPGKGPVQGRCIAASKRKGRVFAQQSWGCGRGRKPRTWGAETAEGRGRRWGKQLRQKEPDLLFQIKCALFFQQYIINFNMYFG